MSQLNHKYNESSKKTRQASLKVHSSKKVSAQMQEVQGQATTCVYKYSAETRYEHLSHK